MLRTLVPAFAFVSVLAFACGGESADFKPQATPTALGASDQPAATTPAASPACAPTEYEVQSGDTLGAIATAKGVEVQAIVEANSLPDADVLSLGQKLIIPCATPAAATPAPSP